MGQAMESGESGRSPVYLLTASPDTAWPQLQKLEQCVELPAGLADEKCCVIELGEWVGSGCYEPGDRLILATSEDFGGNGDYLLRYLDEIWLTRLDDAEFCYLLYTHDGSALAVPKPDSVAPELRRAASFDPAFRLFGKVIGGFAAAGG
ncbi:MAG: hypothetical protein QM296_03985 [Bacillota bacterium]|nr:hypothetical protein [Bacillota bacterium]